jgi:prepilin-type N-terminal cleavage/methylation domain-containing protein
LGQVLSSFSLIASNAAIVRPHCCLGYSMKHLAEPAKLASRWKSKRRATRRCRERGFTLVEMMIASLVFTVAIVSLMSMVMFALAARYSSRIDSAALKLSQHKLEELKAHTLDHPALSISGNVLDANGKIDFDAAADPQATATTQVLLNAARNTNLGFETRWNITTSGVRKIITVATRKTGGAALGVEPANLKVVLAP